MIRTFAVRVRKLHTLECTTHAEYACSATRVSLASIEFIGSAVFSRDWRAAKIRSIQIDPNIHLNVNTVPAIEYICVIDHCEVPLQWL